MTSTIDRRALIEIIETEAPHGASDVGQFVARAPAEAVRLSRGQASNLAKTFDVKYRMARDRGVVVVGLEEFLTELNDGRYLYIVSAYVPNGPDFAVIVLDAAMSKAIGAIEVYPGDAARVSE